MPHLCLNWMQSWKATGSLPEHTYRRLDKACTRACIPAISTPTDIPPGLVVAACTVAEVLAGWVGVPAEALLDTRDPGNG